MIIKCKNCNNDFECDNRKYNFNTKNGLNIFCSSKCYSEYKKKDRVIKPCATCGKEVSKPLAQANRSKTGNLYCSKTCATITNNTLFKKWENHPSYKSGESRYRNMKLSSIESPLCERCGYDNILALEVHHKDRNRKNNNLDNLEILCCNCHTIEHRTRM